MNELMEKLPMILAVLLGISEALAHIPSVKSNSVFQMVVNMMKKIKEVMSPKKEESKEDAK
jgi:hypothetical protein